MIQQYIKHLETVKGYSQNTLRAYAQDLWQFVTFIKTRPNNRWSTIQPYDIDDYVTYLTENGKSPSTINRALTSINGIYLYIERQGHNIANPCEKQERKKYLKREPNTIPTEDLVKAWKHAYGIAKVMIGLFMTTGMRLQELLDMEWEDINFETNTIKIKAKWGKQRTVMTTAEHLETLKMVHANNPTKGRIFTIDQRQARHLVYNALRPYSNARQLSPHAIRHTYATELAKKGIATTTIAKALGHQNIATTQKYVDMGQLVTMSDTLVHAIY